MTYDPLTSWMGTKRVPPTSGEILRDVDLFASGHYRGKDYTVADLEEMAANFDKLGPKGLKLLDPPACLGHEETQAYLDRTDLPAAGWVRRLRVVKYHEHATGQEEAVLKGDIVGVPKSIANRIRSRQYRKVSAEVYSDFTDDFGKSYGKALRRVAFLGAEVPQVKRIGDLPMPEPDRFSEPRSTRLRPSHVHAAGDVVCFFSEVVTMGDDMKPPGRQERIEAILAVTPALGMPTLEGMTDDQLSDFAKNLPPTAPTMPNNPTTPYPADPAMDPMTTMPPAGAPPMGAVPMGGELSREEMIAELSALGQDPTALQGMADADLANLFAQMSQGGGMAAMGDPASMTPEEMIAELADLGEDPATLSQMSEEELRALYAELTTGDSPAAPAGDAAMMSEFFRRRRASAARTNQFQSYAETLSRRNVQVAARQHGQLKRQDAEAFCDQLTKEGRLLPAHREIFLGDLLSKDNLTPAVTFSEGGRKTRLTAYEAKKKVLAQLPVVIRFAERVEAGKRADAARRTPDREKRAVERFAEENAGSLKGSGLTPAKFVERFTEMQKKNPALTAVQALGPDARQYYAEVDE